jgi:predicted ATP-dependent endonuclease of OLD family
MILKEFTIQNVKSIDNCKSYVDEDITTLAGQNEAGKTSIFEALNFFRNGADEKFKMYAMDVYGKKPPIVTCAFELEKEDFIINEGDSKDEKQIKDILQKFDKDVNIYLTRKGGDGKIEVNQNTTLELFRLIKREEKEVFKHLFLIVAEKIKESNEPSQKEVIKKEFEENLNNERVNLCREIIKYLISSLPVFSYYKSFDDNLPDSIMVNELNIEGKFKAVKDFQEVLEIDLKTLINESDSRRTNILDKSLRKHKINFNDYYKQKITENEDYNFSITIDGQKIFFYIQEGEKCKLFCSQRSTGFQWFCSFFLRLEALKKAGKKYILLIDEPGQGLHEKAQEDVKNVLEGIKKDNESIQVLYSTHNPILIDTDKHIDRLRLVHKTEEEGTKIYNLQQFASQKDGCYEYTLSPIRTAMGLSHGTNIDKDKLNIIFEGMSEKYYFEAFKLLLNIDPKEAEYSFIPGTGADNIQHLMSILFGWGCSFKVVMDKKPSSFNKIKKAFYDNNNGNIDSQIRQLDENGIEDLFTSEDFKESVCKHCGVEVKSDLQNSKAIENSKKMICALFFLKNVKEGKIKKNNLSKDTINNFQKIFDWFKEPVE